jgi:excinuclease ABC subunit C
MSTPEHLQLQLRALPGNPGVYQFFDTDGRLLYVGKAKNLKKRVSSYFTKEHYSGRTALMVSRINEIKYIVTNTDLDALLLENNLIKTNKPKYNIELKDDKSYPSICIKNERFPRVFPTRRLIKDGSSYYGPYASVSMMHSVLDLIRSLYKIRTCNLNLAPENVNAGKFKVCLEYHIHNCKGPCVAKETEEEYNETIAQVREIIKGNISGVTRTLNEQMVAHAANMEFEQAHVLKVKMEQLERFKIKSTVVSQLINDVEVYTIETDENHGFVNFMKVVNGSVIQGHTIEMKKGLEETPKELLELGIAEIKNLFNTKSKEILVPFEVDLEIDGSDIIIPQRGDKKKLMELSQRNVQAYIKDRNKQLELVDPDRHTKRILETMKKDLRLTEVPVHIECFDNSNIQGAFPVAAMTVFKNAKPSKKDYRHFNIKTVEGPNDFASMEEIIYRRYKRVLDEGLDMPQLIVIDGGKGQLSSAINSLEKLGLRGKVGIIGIAKKLEEIYFPGDPYPMYIDKRSESLRIIQQIRDEAHRFGITHHRKKRSKETITTELLNIQGIGEKLANDLLNKFKSVKRIKETPIAEIEKEIGPAKAKLILDYFEKQKKADK